MFCFFMSSLMEDYKGCLIEHIIWILYFKLWCVIHRQYIFLKKMGETKGFTQKKKHEKKIKRKKNVALSMNPCKN